MNRKPRSDSRIDNHLRPELKAELEQWLFRHPMVSIEECAKRLFDQYGFRTSATAVRAFYRRRLHLVEDKVAECPNCGYCGRMHSPDLMATPEERKLSIQRFRKEQQLQNQLHELKKHLG